MISQQGRAGTAAATSQRPAAAGSARAWPNPSADGRYHLRLPATWQGAVRYRLLTALGATVATGTLPADAPESALDFSGIINASGCYYLLLENDHGGARLKLLRQ